MDSDKTEAGSRNLAVMCSKHMCLNEEFYNDCSYMCYYVALVLCGFIHSEYSNSTFSLLSDVVYNYLQENEFVFNTIKSHIRSIKNEISDDGVFEGHGGGLIQLLTAQPLFEYIHNLNVIPKKYSDWEDYWKAIIEDDETCPVFDFKKTDKYKNSIKEVIDGTKPFMIYFVGAMHHWFLVIGIYDDRVKHIVYDPNPLDDMYVNKFLKPLLGFN